MQGSVALNGHMLLLNIAGSVALLLWAARMVRTGITRAYGAEIRRFLGRFTKRSLSAFAIGTGVAAVLQSSTATVLLAVSFASRGFITVAAGLALMLGADVGTTLVVQVLSFDISWASPALLLLGVAGFLGSSWPLVRHLGRVSIGLGLLLLSLQLLVAASEPLRDSQLLAAVVAPLAHDPILAVLLAALLTWVAHSSVAIVLLVMSFVAVGVLPPALGFALVLGANVGSGIVPMVLTLSSSPVTRRIPLGNLLFRVCGAIIVLPLIGLVEPLIALIESDPARQIANFHTLFNLALAAVFLPFIGLVARLTERIFPDSGLPEGPAVPRHLDPTAVATPTVALACATREVLRMADTVETMLRGVIDVFRDNDAKQIVRLSKLDDDVDALHEAIKLYLTKLSGRGLDDGDSQRCIELITFTTNLEHIGDIIDKNLLELGQKKVKHKLEFSKEGWRELAQLHARVVEQMQLSLSVFVSGDIRMARRLLALKEGFRDLEREAGERHLERLRSGKIESIETSALHLDILRDLKRINSHLTSVAYPILDAEGELRRSRLKVDADADSLETEADQHDVELGAGKPFGGLS
jgi:phosphate:Na+ symporter